MWTGYEKNILYWKDFWVCGFFFYVARFLRHYTFGRFRTMTLCFLQEQVFLEPWQCANRKKPKWNNRTNCLCLGCCFFFQHCFVRAQHWWRTWLFREKHPLSLKMAPMWTCGVYLCNTYGRYIQCRSKGPEEKSVGCCFGCFMNFRNDLICHCDVAWCCLCLLSTLFLCGCNLYKMRSQLFACCNLLHEQFFFSCLIVAGKKTPELVVRTCSQVEPDEMIR